MKLLRRLSASLARSLKAEEKRKGDFTAKVRFRPQALLSGFLPSFPFAKVLSRHEQKRKNAEIK